MKYIAVILVAIGFYWAFADKLTTPRTEPARLPARPGELSDVEKEYYVKVFDYAMAALPRDEKYEWKSSDTNSGIIVASAPFVSKSKYNCRSFSESFVIDGKQGQHQGVACKREGADGWCRLKASDALTCALENPATIAVNYNFPGADTSVPDIRINTGGIGGIGAPSAPGVSAPDMPGGPRNQKEAGSSYADTVTGTAGNAAGPTAKGAKDWFNNTFR